jgi:hypothetical protein
MRKHIQIDGCQHCKEILRNIFFIENNKAGSTGAQPTEPARDVADTTQVKYLHDI